MTPEEHKVHHNKLHKDLDELVADYLRHTKGSLMGSTIMDLIRWSADQTVNPTEGE